MYCTYTLKLADQPWTATFSLLNDTHFLIDVILPHNSYLGLGFGNSMFDSDMVIFQARLKDVAVTDTWSSGYEVPENDR